VSESSIVAETAARIFADLADPQEINRAKDGAWKGPLWRALADAGLTLAWVPEEQGGAGADLADGFAVLGVAGRYAAAVPLAETLLAGWLLSRAGLKAPEGRNVGRAGAAFRQDHVERRRHLERTGARRAVRQGRKASRGAGRVVRRAGRDCACR
jgi:alkylation response protein AidB-like acyl-CoA dehydrogenase